MFIGTITMRNHTVEVVEVIAHNYEEAVSSLAEYVYKTYNKTIPQDGSYYTGVVTNTVGLKTIGQVELKVS